MTWACCKPPLRSSKFNRGRTSGHLCPDPKQEAINAFLLGFPTLLSIVNPISGAFIFNKVAPLRPPAERAKLVAVYSLVVVVVVMMMMMMMMVALWAGSFLLAFFGIILAALRVAGNC
jgi:multiple antibiotic resistance protein